MFYRIRIAIACGVAAMGFLGAAAAATTGEGAPPMPNPEDGAVICTTRIDAITVSNLQVPQNASCQLYKTRVTGTIKVANNATLIANQIMVIGSIESIAARNVFIASSRIGRSIILAGGGAVRIISSTVDGTIQLENNRALSQIVNNYVGANLQAFSNTGGVHLFDNRIDGIFVCNSNNPAPIGSGNTVQGVREGQCFRLSGRE